MLGRNPDASYRIVPGLLTGGFSFGTTAQRNDRAEDVTQVMFLEAPDSQGVPHPTTASLENLVHELAHSYVNPVFDSRVERMRASAEPLFALVADAMRAQAYTSYPIMVNESVVRAITSCSCGIARARPTRNDPSTHNGSSRFCGRPSSSRHSTPSGAAPGDASSPKPW